MRKLLALLSLLILPVAVAAQVSISASHVADASEHALVSAKLCFAPVDATAKDTGFRVGTVQIVPGAVCGLVSNGALQSGLSLAPNPTGTYYHLWVASRTTNAVIRDYGMTAITGSSWTLDTYDPSMATVPITGLQVGSVTSLPFGSSPTASLSGSSPILLNLGIPTGATGAPGATGPAGGNTNLPTLAVGADLSTMMGDSLTMGTQDSTIPWPAQVQGLLNRPMTNWGITGQLSGQICARMSACPTYVTSGITIPTSGSVTVAFTTNYEPCYNAELAPNLPNGVLGTIAGVTGYCTDNGSHVYTFTPTTYPSSPVSVSAGTQWFPVHGNLFAPGSCMNLDAGRNSVLPPAVVANTEADITAMVSFMQSKTNCWSIMTLPHRSAQDEWIGGSNRATVDGLNTWIKAQYGAHVIDIDTMLVNDYDPNNPVDVLDHTHGVTPYSLRADLGAGTIAAGIADASTCVFITSGSGLIAGNLLKVDSEFIMINGGSNGAWSCTRGFGSTATSHAAGVSYERTDNLHPGHSASNPNCASGPACIASLYSSTISAGTFDPSPVIPMTYFFRAVKDALGAQGSSNGYLTMGGITSTNAYGSPVADMNAELGFPWSGWTNGSSLNAPTTASYACGNPAVGDTGNVLQMCANGAGFFIRYIGGGTPGPWTQFGTGLALGGLTTTGSTAVSDLNTKTAFPWAGFANGSTANEPVSGCFFTVGNPALGNTGSVLQMASTNCSGQLHFWLRQDNSGTWGPWEAVVTATENTVTYSATPTFSAGAKLNTLTLTGNVTSSTLTTTNAQAGFTTELNICQDATGGRTFVWPTTVLNAPTISATASACTKVPVTYSAIIGKWIAPPTSGGSGTVTSVALSMPADETVSGSPVTGSGTISVTRNNQSANTVMAGPASGSAAAPGYRALVLADMPLHLATSTSCTGTATSSATLMLAGTTSVCTSSATAGVGWSWPFAVTLSNLTVRCGTTGVNSSSGVFTVYKQAVGASSMTAASMTVTYGTTTANNTVVDSTHTVSLNAGDLMQYRFTTQASETLANCAITMQVN